MNHVFKLVWSRSLGMLVPVPEVSRSVGHGGRSSARARRRLAKRAMQNAGLGALAVLAPSSAYALPQGGSVAAGTASISTNASTLTVNQTSAKAIINWQKFSVGAGETVNFQQPGSSSIALNRVLGNDPSQIFGRLTANGQIFLVNPNGIVFAPGAQVNVGGLVASTLDMTDQNFLSGNYQFSGVSTASVVNYGKIKTFDGGYVAFIGNSVDNEGVIKTPGGTTALGAGGSVAITLAGNSLVSYQVTTAALNASVKNGGAIIAPNGVVLLTAQAKNALLQTVVNNTGLIQANSATRKGGVVTLLGGSSGTVAVSGTINANSTSGVGGTVVISGVNTAVSGTARISATGSTGGGTIAIGGGVHGGAEIPQAVTTSVDSGAVVDASATGSGAGGTVSVWSDVTNPNSVTTVSGSILAKGAGSGAGGFVETSGHLLNINAARVDTGGGTWLLDPYNVTITSNSSNGTPFSTNYTSTNASAIQSSAIESALANNNVDITTGGLGDATSNGNITVNAPISWGAATTLTLNAAGNIVINAGITGSNATAGLVLDYGQATAAGTGASYTINAPINLDTAASNAFNGFKTKQGSSGTTNTYAVINTQAELQAIGSNSTNLSGNYALGTNITASSNFTPIGNGGSRFTGKFEGLGHTISNVTISSSTNVGLFGVTSNATIRDVGLTNVSVTGSQIVGGLVGWANNTTILNSYVQGGVVSASGGDVGGLVGTNSNGTITDSYATGSVTGTSNVGGLVGKNSNGTISDAYATGAVTDSGNQAGGLVGYNNNSTITVAYAAGAVSGSVNTGGLVGDNINGTITDAYAAWNAMGVTGSTNTGGLVGSIGGNSTITNVYATSKVTGSGGDIGGLVGSNNGGTITNGYWDMATASITKGVGNNGSATGVTGVATTAALAAALPTGFSSSVWTNASNKTTPYLIANKAFSTVSGAVLVGTDTSATPTVYGVINNQTQLQNINTTGLSGNYVLGNNITTTGNFAPIGNGITKFTGMFDGLDHTISNLTIIEIGESGNVGLFGRTMDATIRDVGLVAENVTGGGSFVGGLVGRAASSKIINSYANDTVKGGSNTGGLVGSNNNGMIADSYATGSVTGTSNVGGLVGENSNGTISDAYATGAVTGSGNQVGGLVGSSIGGNSTITNAYATGKVTGSGADIGGLVGSNNGGTIINGYWDTATAGEATAGVGNSNNSSVTGLTTAALAGTLTGFSTNVWANAGGKTTPYLIANEAFSTVSGAVLLGTDTSATPTVYGVITSQTQLQNINSTATSLSGDYVLGNNITATGTFTPIGTNGITAQFKGIFDGLGHTISGLTIQESGNSGVGLFGYTSNATLRNIELVGENVTGDTLVGGLVGSLAGGGTITNSFVQGNVNGTVGVGGLVGSNGSNSTITNAYAAGAVSGSGIVGGLVGENNSGIITDAYATANVTGTNTMVNSKIGGLVGWNVSGIITDAYATGAVSDSTDLGGLVGANTGTITDGYWDTATAGEAMAGVGNSNNSNVTGLTTAQWLTGGPGKTNNFFTNASAWVEGYPFPVLSALPYIIITGSASQTYGAALGAVTTTSVSSGSGVDESGLLTGTVSWISSATGTPNAGSTVQLGGSGAAAAGYQVTYGGTDTATQKAVTITGLSGTDKTYNGTNGDLLTGTAVIGGLVNGQTLTLDNATTGTLANSNAGLRGVNTAITLADGTGSNAGLAANYILTVQPTLAPVTVTPAVLTITGLSGTAKTYDGSASDALTGTAIIGGLVGGQNLTLGNDTTGTLDNSNAGLRGVNANITLADGTGTNAGLASNYTLTQPTLAPVTVTPAVLTITGLSGTDKTFDGTTSDSLTGTPSISGLIGGQTVTLSNDTTGTLASANAGIEGVTTDIILGSGANGWLAGNYTLVQPTLAPVTVSPVTAVSPSGTVKVVINLENAASASTFGHLGLIGVGLLGFETAPVAFGLLPATSASPAAPVISYCSPSFTAASKNRLRKRASPCPTPNRAPTGLGGNHP